MRGKGRGRGSEGRGREEAGGEEGGVGESGGTSSCPEGRDRFNGCIGRASPNGVGIVTGGSGAAAGGGAKVIGSLTGMAASGAPTKRKSAMPSTESSAFSHARVIESRTSSMGLSLNCRVAASDGSLGGEITSTVS